MSQKMDSNDLAEMEYEDDDALILLDDEEMQTVSKNNEEELESFYLDYPDNAQKITQVDLYTENVSVEKTIPENEETLNEDNIDSIQDGYQGQLEKLTNNIDAYLNGVLEVKPKEEDKVEQLEPVIVPVASQAEVPIYSKPVVQSITKPIEEKIVITAQPEQAEISNLNQLFAKVEGNVKGASDIVNKNAEIKRKIDERYSELQRLQAEHEKNKQSDYAEINAYKDEVYDKLKAKKIEIEEQTLQLKREQEMFLKEKAIYEQEKANFEKERNEALENVIKKEKELHDSYNERTKNIEQVENGLIRRKEQLDIEKATISRERENIEIEKKELAENLIKFNQLVDNFTKGVDRFNETN